MNVAYGNGLSGRFFQRDAVSGRSHASDRSVSAPMKQIGGICRTAVMTAGIIENDTAQPTFFGGMKCETVRAAPV